MKKLILFLFLISFVITNISCKKLFKKHTIVEGKVINYGSKQPIEGVMVVMQDGIQAGGLINAQTSSDKKSVTYTDANGNFHIELSGDYGAGLYCKKDKYNFEVSIQGASQGIMGYGNGTFSDQILEMKAEAYWNPVYKSKSQSYNDDNLYIEILSLYNGKYSITGIKDNYYGKGPFKYTGVYPYRYLSIGDTYQPFKLTLTRQGTVTSKIDSVYIKSLEFYRDTIYY